MEKLLKEKSLTELMDKESDVTKRKHETENLDTLVVMKIKL